MASRKWVLVTVVAALSVAACSDPEVAPPAQTTPPPSDNVVRIVNLNAAMGHHLEAGDPRGTDATEEDYVLLADDIVSQRGDIANLQEMALPAAERVAEILTKRTGDQWQLNWATSGKATYYAGKVKDKAQDTVYQNVPAGNAQLVRIGDGITAQKPITLDDQNDDQGIVLPSEGRSFVGAEITTAWGKVDVYNTHLALADVDDAVRARDVRLIQKTTESRPGPAVLTGDFNEVIDFAPGLPPMVVTALRAFVDEFGYTDVARDKGPTSDQKYKTRIHSRIDYILARGVDTTETVRFVSHESDHWGLATTLASARPRTRRRPRRTTTTTTTTAPPAGPTTEGAIARYEQFLHAVGAEDIATVCEIAGPAAKQAEDQGFGPCEQTMRMMFSMISPEQKTALKSATVDPAQVSAQGTTVEIPAAAIRAAVPFTSSDLGDSTLSFLNGQWFVTD